MKTTCRLQRFKTSFPDLRELRYRGSLEECSSLTSCDSQVICIFEGPQNPAEVARHQELASKRIIQTYDLVKGKLRETKDIISDNTRVATIYSIGLHDLPPYIKKFLKNRPSANVHVE